MPPNPPEMAWYPDPLTVKVVGPEVEATAPPSELDTLSRAAACAGGAPATTKAAAASSAASATATHRCGAAGTLAGGRPVGVSITRTP